VGLTVIMVSSVTLTGSSQYPGALVAIPTLGAGLVVAAGAAEPTWGVERLLRRRTFQFLAAISFPLYLWHWPILEIAAQSRGVASLPVVGQRPAVARGGRTGDADLLLLREPYTPLPIPGAASLGQPRHGPVSHRRHARRDDVRATPAHGESGNPHEGHVGLYLLPTIAEWSSQI
jgi:hypothetical protein